MLMKTVTLPDYFKLTELNFRISNVGAEHNCVYFSMVSDEVWKITYHLQTI